MTVLFFIKVLAFEKNNDNFVVHVHKSFVCGNKKSTLEYDFNKMPTKCSTDVINTTKSSFNKKAFNLFYF